MLLQGFFTANFESSPTLLAEYLRHVRRQEPDFIPDPAEEGGEFDDPLDEMHDWILQPFLPIFREIAPLKHSRKYTLEDCLFAEEFHYTVHVVKDGLVPVYLGNVNDQKNHLIEADLTSSMLDVDYSIFPVYHPSEIQLPIDTDPTALPGIPHKVIIHGRSKPSFFKIVYAGDVKITMRELIAYSKIDRAKFDATVRTSRLDGLVKDKDGRVMGMLSSYIDCGGSTLYCVDGRDPEYLEDRQK